MRSTRYLKCFISVLLISLVTMSTLYAGVVNLDVNAKSISADSKTINSHVVLIRNGRSVFNVSSTIFEPQTFTLKISGLAEPAYDIYVNKTFSGKQTAQALSEGVEFQLQGRVVEDNLVRCLDSVKEKLSAEYKRIKIYKDVESQRVAFTLGQADDWVRSGLSKEQAIRSAFFMIVPAGTVLKNISGPTMLDTQQTARTVTRACWLLQQARAQMFKSSLNPHLMNTAIIAMTPVDFSAVYSMKNGKPHIDAVLTNNCDLPINGNISLGLPKGWKTNVKSLKFSDLKSGNTLNLAFDLIAPAKNTAAPESIPIAANMTITQDTLTADLKLKVIAANAPSDGAK